MDQTKGIQLVKDIYQLCKEKSSQELITGIYNMASNNQPLDDSLAQRIAVEVIKFLPKAPIFIDWIPIFLVKSDEKSYDNETSLNLRVVASDT